MRTPRVVIFLFTVALAWTLGASPALSAKRIALVIGNSAYKSAPLANPVNDARLMALTLRKMGFEVQDHYDLRQNQIKRAIRDFGQRLERAGKDAVSLFYYAGHGVQVGGRNYLIPVGAEIQNEGDVDIEAVPADVVLSTMEFAGSRLNFVILDACRNNPYARSFRSASRGLARMEAPSGTLVAYATAPGDVAADGGGSNSPYTAALVEAMKIPGLASELVFREARRKVMAATKKAQVPWEASSLTGDFYFVPKGSTVTVVPPSGDRRDKEALFWETIKESDDKADFEAYLAEYPDGKFVRLAKNRLRKLKKPQTAAVTPLVKPKPVPSPAKPAVGVYPSKYKPGDTFKDCAECPEMVVIPPGRYMMGSLETERGHRQNEEPRHEVQITQVLAVGKYEVKRGEFEAFVTDSNHSMKRIGCNVVIEEKGEPNITRGQQYSWRYPGFEQSDDHPVVCVAWYDANEYTKWLSRKTGGNYRLLSEAEWEYAARANTETLYYWGDLKTNPTSFPLLNELACQFENITDQMLHKKFYKLKWLPPPCSDGYAFTAPVGSYKPNPFHLYDILGNVHEWVQDCYRNTYYDAPNDGTPTVKANCRLWLHRGGAWYFGQYDKIRPAKRNPSHPIPENFVGFRVARTLSR